MQPQLDSRDIDIEVDSNADDSEDEADDDEDDMEDDDPFSNVHRFTKEENVEHSNPHSFAWNMMRHACIILAQQNLERFLSMAGIEFSGKLKYWNILLSTLMRKLVIFGKGYLLTLHY